MLDLPRKINLSARSALAGNGVGFVPRFKAAMSAIRGSPGQVRPTTNSGQRSKDGGGGSVQRRLRFALISAYLANQFADPILAEELLGSLLKLRDSIERQLRQNYHDRGLPFPSESNYPGPKAKESLLYLIVASVKPNLIIETGVDQGVSSYFILEALRRNGSGRLHSIDIGATGASGNSVGWLVPQHLRERWELTLKPAEEALPTVNDMVDIFLHDSLHTQEHMSFEFDWADDHLNPGGILCSDDIDLNQAFMRFLEKHNDDYYPISTKVVGVARKVFGGLA